MTADGVDFLVRDMPFRHAIFASWLSRRTEEKLLHDLEQITWRRDFSPLHHFAVPADDAWRQALLHRLEREFLSDERRRLLEQIFECGLGGDLVLELHKYSAGDGIAPHTDRQFPDVRLVLNVNRRWQMEEGGIWMLSSHANLKPFTTYLPASSNTGFAFSAGANTFHALARYVGEGMYCLVFRVPRL